MEAAVATRKRLHGIKWPSTNPKLLSVDFLTAEEARKLTEGELVIEEELVREDRGKVGVVRTDAKIEEEKEKESKTDVLKMTQERETVDSKEGMSMNPPPLPHPPMYGSITLTLHFLCSTILSTSDMIPPPPPPPPPPSGSYLAFTFT